MTSIETTNNIIFINNPKTSDVVQEAFAFGFPKAIDNDGDKVNRGGKVEIPIAVRRMLHCQWCNGLPSSAERLMIMTKPNDTYQCCSTTLYCHQCHMEWFICDPCSYSEDRPLYHGKGGRSRTSCYVRKQRVLEHIDRHRQQLSVNEEDNRSQDNEEDNNTFQDNNSTSNMIDEHYNTDVNWCNHARADLEDRLSFSSMDIDVGHIGQSTHNIRSVFDNPVTKHLADFMIQEITGNGCNHIIQNSFLGCTVDSTSEKISPTDSHLFTTLLSIGSKMSRDNRDQLALLITLIRKKVIDEDLSSTSTSKRFKRVPLPTSSYAMRKVFEVGKQQFTRYMPIPPITSPIPGYASVPLSHTLQLLYSRGSQFDGYNDTDVFSSGTQNANTFCQGRSVSGGEIFLSMVNGFKAACSNDTPLQNNYAVQPIVLWSDSADLNNVKNNRATLKVHNVYIPHMRGQSVDCVFPLAIGYGKSEHSLYRNLMFDELSDIHNECIKCFDRRRKTNLPVKFFLLAVVQDRPEHSEFTGTIGHNGTYGALPGYSFPRAIRKASLPGIKTVKDLASCVRCFNKRVSKLCNIDFSMAEDNNVRLGENECSQCCDWDVLKVRFYIPDKMPIDIPMECFECNDSNRLMLARPVTFDTIKKTLMFIHHKSYKKEWTNFSNTAKQYASLQCVNASLAMNVYKAAKCLRLLHVQESRYDPSIVPPIDWTGVPKSITSGEIRLEQCMVGIMHTLFLNGGKKLILLIHDLFKKEKSSTFFLTKSKIYFRDLRSLSLNWVMAWPFGSTVDKPLSPWVSENYVAFHHVSKSYISIICKPLIAKGKSGIVNALKILVSIWHRLLSIVMQPSLPTSDDITAVGDLSKLFLSKYHEMEIFLGRTPKDWDLQNASCYMMLLLLPEYMRNFGCLRNFWEGGHMGERSVTILKKTIPHGAPMDATMRSTIRKYFIDVVLKQLTTREHGDSLTSKNISSFNNDIVEDDEALNDDNLDNDVNTGMKTYDRYRRFRCYKSRDVLVDIVNNKKPFSLLFHEQDMYFAVLLWGKVDGKRVRTIYRIDVGHDNNHVIEGTAVVGKRLIVNSLMVEDGSDDFNRRIVSIEDIESVNVISCLALLYETPCQYGNNEPQEHDDYCYYVRTERHTELRGVKRVNDMFVYSFSYPTLFINKDN